MYSMKTCKVLYIHKLRINNNKYDAFNCKENDKQMDRQANRTSLANISDKFSYDSHPPRENE